MNLETFTEAFFQRMYTNRLWQHPFLRSIGQNPSLEQLRLWAIQAGKIDEVFAEILETMLHNPALLPVYHLSLERNLGDEQGNGVPEKEHFTLFRNVLSLIGISEKDYHATPPTRGTAQIISSLRNAAMSNSPLRIVSLMASEETLCPYEFPPFLRAFQRYGALQQLEYFLVHIDADVAHARDLIAMAYTLAAPDNLSHVFAYQQEDLENNVLFYDDLV